MTAPVDGDGSRGPGPGRDGGRPRVVVGVDGSSGSRAALSHAFATAARRGARLEVVCSYAAEQYQPGGETFAVPILETLPEDTEARIRAVVAEVRTELAGEPGIRDVEVAVVASPDPAAIALLERSEGAALLVVGSRGRGAMRSALLGSVALHCVTHASCPVEVVRHAARQGGAPGRVLVGVDGSEGSRAALAAAVDESARRGAELLAVVSYAPADYWTDLTTVVVPPDEEIRAGLEARTDLLVNEVLSGRRDLGERSPTVRIEVVAGPAAEVLVERARSAELLVVGSRGRGTFRGLLLGSVALHCAMHAPCPVQVVHPRRSRSTSARRPEMAGA